MPEHDSLGGFFLIHSTGLGTSLSQKRGALVSCRALLSDWVSGTTSPNSELFYFDEFLYDWRDVVNCFLGKHIE